MASLLCREASFQREVDSFLHNLLWRSLKSKGSREKLNSLAETWLPVGLGDVVLETVDDTVGRVTCCGREEDGTGGHWGKVGVDCPKILDKVLPDMLVRGSRERAQGVSQAGTHSLVAGSAWAPSPTISSISTIPIFTIAAKSSCCWISSRSSNNSPNGSILLFGSIKNTAPVEG